MRMNWYQWLFSERENQRERRLFLYSRRFFSRVIMSITITFLLLLLLFFSSLFLRCLRLYCHRLWRMSSLGDERRSKYECTRQSNKFQDRRTEKDEHIDEKQDMTGEKKNYDGIEMNVKQINFISTSVFLRSLRFLLDNHHQQKHQPCQRKTTMRCIHEHQGKSQSTLKENNHFVFMDLLSISGFFSQGSNEREETTDVHFI